MKKRMSAIALLNAALMLSACASQNVSVNGAATTVSQTETIAAATKPIITAAETMEAETTTAETTVTEIAAETVTETSETEPYDWNGFVLKDHCGEFDEVMPLKYHSWEYTDKPEVEKTRFDAAYQAAVESRYYTEVLEFANEYVEWDGSDFSFKEGERHWALKDLHSFIDYDAAPELVLKPELTFNIQLQFDGVNTEDILLFRFPLAQSEFEWSGRSYMYIVVYVNFKGDAKVLEIVSAQTLSSVTPIQYSDGKIHLDFGRGHTAGTSKSHILSFSNGEENVEYEGTATLWEEDGFILRNDISGFFDKNILLFLDGIRDCYCELKKTALPDEIGKAICADEKVNAEYFSSEYSEPVYALGGKYIVTGTGAFEYDNGEIKPYEHGTIVPSFEEEGISALNVDLTAEVFN